MCDSLNAASSNWTIALESPVNTHALPSTNTHMRMRSHVPPNRELLN